MLSILTVAVVGGGVSLRHAEAGRVRFHVAAGELDSGTGNSSLTGECTEAQHCRYGCMDGDCKENNKVKKWDPCADGWYGIRVGQHEKHAVCDKPCAKGCKYLRCRVEDGECKCPDNFYTKEASKRCMEPCGHCRLGCDKAGHCKEEMSSRRWDPCEPGWYGTVDGEFRAWAVCNKQCPTGCKYGTCSVDGVCKCKDNYYTKEGSEPCQEPCGHCQLGCDKYGHCKVKATARKWDPCESGWYGVVRGDFEDYPVCNKQCSANCKGDRCDPYGHCWCKPGFYTQDESKPCAEQSG